MGGMPRTDNDSWDITESVGATALGVAAARAVETESDDPLIRDPFARVFLDAAGEGVWSVYANPELLSGAAEVEPEVVARVRLMVDFMATRTAFFDEFFLGAADAGVRQVVILASGLDSRAWRLPWPDGTVVYELDQPRVLDFKATTLRRHGAQPTSQLVSIPVDLRQDWPKALQEAGFDASKPSAWSAEGLVRYLPAQAQDLLFERIDALSPSGSWLASNVPGEGFLDPELVRRQRADMRRMRAVAAQLANVEVEDPDDLWYAEERTPLADWLRERGWQVSAQTFAELLARYGRDAGGERENSLPPTLFVSAQRP
ncbi:putative S-adenosyl-L-methionine-dependent methyltransferase [Mycobacterium kiyosense]|uniref:S-adenosyl-L-methionine-dependent methyltransferase n=2 Tax=Mycobacterium kiyosense TaxID=2871094 RepID=A0AA37UZ10_9MYCO|nr:putative S-adenosyl-L-methionine-dependent methyltransferase [Mycobacterium kiyosense]GLB91597.1 putative S-adenosyl-L-methionine-dependent methyltransferase [Mycobacterium kiyosense]GLC09962.1 putative S-adenosyl-L-methionine-dependent methyltransferase [Mycobacterium kiyosense]GLC15139.1 putative S-adenosyl-L-methionine-dependent methyltransferase [Mycobacterium kiyosense]GLC21786.1 putative S-adenosyl-L-methionine-dependent methyltransferase [Mycobacterium kiyosense]